MSVEEARGEFLVSLIEEYVGRDVPILEVGCRSGRNLQFLDRAGFSDLYGVEPAGADSASGAGERFPSGARTAYGDIEEMLGGFEDGRFELVFTVGFFFDREGGYDWLFEELERITSGYLVSIEDERETSEKGRDYGGLYSKGGLEEIDARDVGELPGLESVFFARVFRKRGGHER